MTKQVWPLKDVRPALDTGWVQEAARKAFAAKIEEDDATVRRLLGLWVSECEPSVAYDTAGHVIGLSAPTGQVVIRTVSTFDLLPQLD